MLSIEKVMQLFGKISVFYSTLDFLVTIYILEIVNAQSNEPKNLLHKTLGQKFNIIKNLKKEDVKSFESLQALHSIMEDAISVSNERNRFIHDQWIFNPDDLIKGKISKFSIDDFDSKVFYTEEDFKNLLKRLEDLHNIFNQAALDIPNSKWRQA